MPGHRARGGLIIFLVLALAAASCSELQNLPELRERDIHVDKRQARTSRIYDNQDRVVTTLHGQENRYPVPLRRIPKLVRNAIVAIEDRRFYEHTGVDWRAIVRAAAANIEEGGIAEGGSTITQQYVKTVIISPGAIPEQTLERKIDEAVLARQLENEVGKKEILERYLNTVYFGQGAYGIQAAAKIYFGKNAKELTLSQGATLAGVVKNPEAYNPLDNPRPAADRRNLVIRQMDKLGWVRHRHARHAKHRRLNVDYSPEALEYPAPYFVDYVKRLITYDPRFQVLGRTPEQRQEQLFKGGLKIYTTVDLETQRLAEDAVDGILTEPNDPHGALVAIQPYDGKILAMVGGRDFFGDGKSDRFAKLNLATAHEPHLGTQGVKRRAPGLGRQAGSAFKPFALSAALDQGVPLSKLYDAGGSCITIPGADNGAPYTPCNYEGSAYGKISLLEATVNSVNTVYARLGQEIGPEAVVDMATEMGIRTRLKPVASAPLGSNEVNVLDMASAYGTLAANGRHHRPVAITKIVDGNGKVVYRHDPRSKRVLDPVTAYLATSALEQVIQRGTGTAGALDRDAAGKTGTAQEYRDAWFGGYTPDLVAAVWVGYPEGQIEMKPTCYGSTGACRPTRIQVTGGSWPTQIWQAFMSRALSDVEPSEFKAPASGITTVIVDTRNGCLAGPFTPLDQRAEGVFATGSAPTKSCLEPGDRIKVPFLQGLDLGAALDRLDGRGLAPDVERQAAAGARAGTVIGQSPAAGARIAKGSLVTVVVAKKPEPQPSPSPTPDKVTVPSVIGETRSQARAALAEDFSVSVVTRAEPAPGQAKKNAGRVWNQEPDGGTKALRGSTVTIYVNPG